MYIISYMSILYRISNIYSFHILAYNICIFHMSFNFNLLYSDFFIIHITIFLSFIHLLHVFSIVYFLISCIYIIYSFHLFINYLRIYYLLYYSFIRICYSVYYSFIHILLFTHTYFTIHLYVFYYSRIRI